MIGAILGDMIGAPYEFDIGDKTKDFPLFCGRSEYTDDSVMTVAVAEALLDAAGKSDDDVRRALIAAMQSWGHRYPDAGYGNRFCQWLHAKNPAPYNSFGNGSAMRVSSAGWLYDTLETTRHIARLTAEVTHNHPEGIKGAEAAASAIFMARSGSSKEEIGAYITAEFGYDLSRTCDEIRPTYRHVESCQQTVPEAITAFLEGTDFEDVIRTAVSLGGDCDTLTCIAGGIAEAFYGVPDDLAAEGRRRLPVDMLAVLDRFEDARRNGSAPPTDCIRSAILDFRRTGDRGRLHELMKILWNSHIWIPCNAVLSDADQAAMLSLVQQAQENGDPGALKGTTLSNHDPIRMVPDILRQGDAFYFPVFSSADEMGEYGQHFSKLERPFAEAANLALHNEKHVAGVVVNAFTAPFIVPRNLLEIG